MVDSLCIYKTKLVFSVSSIMESCVHDHLDSTARDPNAWK